MWKATAQGQHQHTWDYRCDACGYACKATVHAEHKTTIKDGDRFTAENQAQRIAQQTAEMTTEDLSVRVACPKCGARSAEARKRDRNTVLIAVLVFTVIAGIAVWLLGYVDNEIVRYGRFGAFALAALGFSMGRGMNRIADEDAKKRVVFLG